MIYLGLANKSSTRGSGEMIFGTDMGYLLIIGIAIAVIAFGTGIFFLLSDVMQNYYRNWTKKKARIIIRQRAINDEKTYWRIRNNLTIMDEKDTEVEYLLEKLKKLKPEYIHDKNAVHVESRK